MAAGREEGDPEIAFPRTEHFGAVMAREGVRLRTQRHFTDFVITVNDASIPCHRYVVCVHSGYLNDMLTSDMAEAAKCSVALDHLDPKAVKAVVGYMYSGEISFGRERLVSVLVAAHFLKIPELLGLCIQEAPKYIQAANALSWMKHIKELGLEALRSVCEKVLISGFVEISKQGEFLELPDGELREYFTQVLESKHERDELLQAVMRWTNYNPKPRAQYLESYLQDLQLQLCSPQAIAEVMEAFAALILSDANIYSLLVGHLKRMLTPGRAKPKLLLVGGHHAFTTNENRKIGYGEVNHDVWLLNDNKKFEKCCRIPFKLSAWHSVCSSPQGFVLSGGLNSARCIKYVASSNSWAVPPQLPHKRHKHGSVVVDGAIYILGGLFWDANARESKDRESGARVYKAKGSVAESVIFLAPGSDRWEEGPALPAADAKVPCPKVAAIGHRIYLLNVTTHNFLQLDLKTKQWNMLSRLHGGGNYHGCSMLAAHGILYVAGGFDGIFAKYQPSLESWETYRLQQKTVHWYGALACQDSALLLFGGSDGDCRSSDAVEEVDIGSTTSSKVQMPASLWNHVAVEVDLAP